MKGAGVEAEEPAVVGEARTKLAEKGLLGAEAKLWIDRSVTTLMWVTAATTVWSGLGYLGGAGTGKVLAARASKVRQTLTKPKPPPS